MVDVKIQTESLLDKGEMSGFKKQKGKKKMTRSNSHTMLNMVAGGAVAGAVFGGIYAAVKIFSKNNNNWLINKKNEATLERLGRVDRSAWFTSPSEAYSNFILHLKPLNSQDYC